MTAAPVTTCQICPDKTSHLTDKTSHLKLQAISLFSVGQILLIDSWKNYRRRKLRNLDSHRVNSLSERAGIDRDFRTRILTSSAIVRQ
jgi:hypothetical protein